MTERMSLGRLLEELGAHPRLLTALVEQLPGGLALLDPEGRLLLHNAQLAAMLGEVPRAARDLVFRGADGREIASDASPVARAARGEQVTGEELRLVRPDGTARRVQVTAGPLRASGGGLLATLLVLMDAEDRPAEDARQREILGIVGHDLRNPLAAIRMTAQLLQKPDEMPAERRITLARRIVSSATRMDTMAKSLLDYARAASGAVLRLERETVDLGVIVRRLVEEQEVTYPDRAVRLDLAGDLVGFWDPGRLEQVVGNLISNALRHGDGPAVAVSADGSDPAAVALSVFNQGPPIPPDLQAHLFEPFRVARAPGGGPRRSVGLGLFIVKQLVTAHGGWVAVRSGEAEGTTFSAHLPRGT